jgi:hypothetical protein
MTSLSKHHLEITTINGKFIKTCGGMEDYNIFFSLEYELPEHKIFEGVN